jgi:hypothetical protein
MRLGNVCSLQHIGHCTCENERGKSNVVSHLWHKRVGVTVQQKKWHD